MNPISRRKGRGRERRGRVLSPKRKKWLVRRCCWLLAAWIEIQQHTIPIIPRFEVPRQWNLSDAPCPPSSSSSSSSDSASRHTSRYRFARHEIDNFDTSIFMLGKDSKWWISLRTWILNCHGKALKYIYTVILPAISLYKHSYLFFSIILLVVRKKIKIF